MSEAVVNGAADATRAELRRVLEVARRWWWLLVLGPLLVAAVAYAASAQRPPRYAATATLGVNLGQNAIDVDINTVQGSKALTETYRQLIASDAVLQPVVAALGLPYGVDGLRDRLDVSAVRDAQLLTVAATDPDPARAARIANAVADQFVAFITGQARAAVASSRAALGAQVRANAQENAEVVRQLDAARAAGAAGGAGQAGADALAARLSALGDERQRLLGQLDQLALDAAGADGRVAVVVPAAAPTEPSGPGPLRAAAIGALAGLVLAVGAVVLLELLDDRVKTVGQAATVLGGAPNGGVIAMPPPPYSPKGLFVLSQPGSSAAASLRTLQTAVEAAWAGRGARRIVVTSPESEAGKTAIAANLGIAMVQSGMKVALIDADCRQPALHGVFDVTNERGLTTLLDDGSQPWAPVSANGHGPNLTLIPAGPAQNGVVRVLDSGRLQRLLGEIDAAVDMVLIDAPPLLAGGGAVAAAARADGAVVVCRAGQTSREALARATSDLGDLDVPVLAVVLAG